MPPKAGGVKAPSEAAETSWEGEAPAEPFRVHRGMRGHAGPLAPLHALFVNTPRLKRLYQEEDQRVTLGDLIRELREKRGLTQAQVARKIGSTQSAIARIEDADHTGQKLGTIAKIATALGHQVEVNLVKVKA